MAGIVRRAITRGKAYRDLTGCINSDTIWRKRHSTLVDSLRKLFQGCPPGALECVLSDIRWYDANRLRHLTQRSRTWLDISRLRNWEHLGSHDHHRSLSALATALKRFLQDSDDSRLVGTLETIPDEVAMDIGILVQVGTDITKDLSTNAPELLRRTLAAIAVLQERSRTRPRGGKPTDGESRYLAKNLAHVAHDCGWLDLHPSKALPSRLHPSYLALIRIVFQDYLSLYPDSRAFRSRMARMGAQGFLTFSHLCDGSPPARFHIGQVM